MKDDRYEIDAEGMDYRRLNELVRDCGETRILIRNCCGQRYLASGSGGREILVEGIPGNALGAYLDGTKIRVRGNAQEATGDTMNGGEILIEGDSGDATGYAMRGGRIFVRGNAGYRAGIHMKAYRDRVPALVIGGRAGDFLGEYLAGGVIVVLGMGSGQGPVAGSCCGTGMHGGKIYLRGRTLPAELPAQVKVRPAGEADLESIRPLLRDFAAAFGLGESDVQGEFMLLEPDSDNPYRQMYVNN